MAVVSLTITEVLPQKAVELDDVKDIAIDDLTKSIMSQGGDGKCQPNTADAFDRAIADGYTILGPSVMKTKDTLVVNHDEDAYDMIGEHFKIKQASRAEIATKVIPKKIPGVPNRVYEKETKYLFLDEFIQRYYKNPKLKFFLDIKSRLNNFDSDSTAAAIFDLLEVERLQLNEEIPQFYARFWLDADNPITVWRLTKEAKARKLTEHAQIMFDYSNIGCSCLNSIYNSTKGKLEARYATRIMAMQNTFYSKEESKKWGKNGKGYTVVVWGVPYAEIKEDPNIDYYYN